MRTRSFTLLGSSAVVLALVVLVLGAAGGTYASWTASESVPEGRITSGTAGLTVTGPAQLGTDQLYPGQASTFAFSTENVGAVPLGLRVEALTWPADQATAPQTALADKMTISVWPDTGPGCASAPPATAFSGPFFSAGGDLGVTVAPGATQPMCLAVALSPDTPNSAQGAGVALQLTLGGEQRP